MGLESAIALAGLAAAVVPLLVQVRSRRADRTVPFPDVHLIRRTEREAFKRQVVAGAPLLLVRVAIVVCASIALSLPYIGALPPNAQPLRAGRVCVLLDRSTSWPDEGSFVSGRAAARDVLRASRGAAFLALIPFDDVPGLALHGDEAARRVEAIERGGGDADVTIAVRAGLDALGRGGASHGEDASGDAATLVVISSAPSLTGVRVPAIPDGVRVFFLGRPAGGRVTRCRITSAAIDGGDLHVDVQRCDSPQPVDLVVRADDDPRHLAHHRLPLASGARAARVVVPLPKVRRGVRLLSVELACGDGCAPPHRFVSLDAPGPRRVGVPSGSDAGPDGCVLGRAAIALSAASASSPEGGRYEAVPTAASIADGAGLAGLDAVVLTAAEVARMRDWRDVREFVRFGGSVVAMLPDRWSEDAAALLGVSPRDGRAAGRIRLVSGGGRHDVGGIEFRSRVRARATSARPWLLFDDGTAAVYERRVGRGRALSLCIAPGELGADPSAAVRFAATVMDRAVAPGADAAVACVTDGPLTMGLADRVDQGNVWAESPNGKRLGLPVARSARDDKDYVSIPCDVPGLWRLVTAPAAANGHCLVLVGVNPTHGTGSSAPRADAARAPVRELGSASEMLRVLDGRGAVRLGPVFAALAVLACIAEPLVRRRMKTGGAA